MFSWGRKPERVFTLAMVDDLPCTLTELKRRYEILVIDDKGFEYVETLQANGFRVSQWSDIEEVNSVERFPIVACDISGIGKKLRPGSMSGGIHVMNEVKKHYPDKYLIQYSTKSQDIDGSLTRADKIYPKDTTIDVWQSDIEGSLRELGNPKRRWIRMRGSLSDQGIDALEIYKLEQAYIKEVLGEESEAIKNQVSLLPLTPEIKDVMFRFALTTAVMGFKEALKG